MRLILVRHGETPENRKDMCQQPMGGHLSLLGKRQAKRLARYLEREAIELIISSPAKRAVETDEIIIKCVDAPLKYDKLCVERNMGYFIGKTMKEYHKAMGTSKKPKYLFRPEKGESYADLAKRAGKFFKAIKNRKEKTILIVTHGAFIRAFLSCALKIPLKKAWLMHQKNACVSIIESNSRTFKAVKINYTKHLSGLK